MNPVQAFLSSAYYQAKMSLARGTFRFSLVLQPIVLGTIMRFTLPAAERATYVVMGTSLAIVWGTVVFSTGGDIERERMQGTLEPILAAPAPFPVVVAGKALGNMMLGLVSTAILLTYLRFCRPVAMSVLEPGWLLVAVPVALFSLLGLALSMAAALARFRQANMLVNGLEYPVLILSGFTFPLAMLPAWIMPLSFGLPTTWAALTLHQAVAGPADERMFRFRLAGLLGLGLVHLILGTFLLRRAVSVGRCRGTLGLP